jgi:hypothetical protein
MLTFLTTRQATYTLQRYLTDWASDPQRSEIQVCAYEDLPQVGSLTSGAYVFCDQERWTPRQHQVARELWTQLERGGAGFILLNNPHRVLLRYDLLRALHQHGVNRFNVHRLLAAFYAAKFPVFLHSTHGHEGALSPLLHSRDALIPWLFRRIRPRRWNKLIIEEFCDVSDHEGFFCKYGAFCVRGEIIPRHLFFSKNWMLKDTDLLNEDLLVRYRDYLQNDSHQDQLQKIFSLAGIDYGRIDYAFYQGQLQVWEINTNPMLIEMNSGDPPEEILLAEVFHERIWPKLQRLAHRVEKREPLSYRLSSPF